MVKELKRLEAKVQSLKHTNSAQTVEIDKLNCCLKSKDIVIIELKGQLNTFQEENVGLKARITSLEEELLRYRTKKNSSNSSIPPSQDPNRIKRTESLRECSGRKPGGQPGHEGSCLEMVAEPTETIIHQPNYCTCCGNDLSEIPAEFVGKRQVIDIPPVTPIVIEHQIFRKRCRCGHLTESDYPVEAHSPVCYGPRIQGLTAYFHSRQYITFERLRELYIEVFGLSISSGILVEMVGTLADKSKGIYEEIRSRICVSPTVGADETGVNINGKNRWAWVFQTPELTYIHADLSRSKKVVYTLFPQGFPQSILVHDCWASYFGVQAQGHQICTAHLLRDLKYLGKLYKEQQWSQDFSSLLHDALELKKTLYTENCGCEALQQRNMLEEQVDKMLAQTTDSRHEKLTVFKERMLKYRNYLLTFLHRPEVPPDNNASERAIRTFKVKQKVSGLFRTEDGAKAFAIIRSIIDTTIKNNNNVWEALALIAAMPVKYQDSS